MRKRASSFPRWVTSSPGVTHRGPRSQASGVPQPLPRAGMSYHCATFSSSHPRVPREGAEPAGLKLPVS